MKTIHFFRIEIPDALSIFNIVSFKPIFKLELESEVGADAYTWLYRDVSFKLVDNLLAYEETKSHAFRIYFSGAFEQAIELE